MSSPKQIKIGCLNTFATKIIILKVNKIENQLSLNCLNLIYIRSFKCITVFINNSLILNGQNLHFFKLLKKWIIFSLKLIFLSKRDKYTKRRCRRCPARSAQAGPARRSATAGCGA